MDIDGESLLKPMEGVQPIRIFYCYAREDKRYRDLLEKYLSTMKRSAWVSSWHDSMINAGEDWERRIDEQIKAANVILLLISPDFMHSNYCYGVDYIRYWTLDGEPNFDSRYSYQQITDRDEVAIKVIASCFYLERDVLLFQYKYS
jgi:hypothetical protein